MNAPGSVRAPALEDRAFLLLLAAVSLAFAWTLWPYSGTVLWAIVIAIWFAPLYRRLAVSLHGRHTLAALATVAIVVLIVILPVTLITAALVREAAVVYAGIEAGDWDPGRSFQQARDALPAWAVSLLDRFELTHLGAVAERLSAGLLKGSQFLATRALRIGQHTFDFVLSLFAMLYLLFFLLRDGDALSRRIRQALPLREEHKHAFIDKFAVVIRATVKGNIVVAALQGALGGLIFWLLGIHAALLWAALMAVVSLLPAVGSSLVWLPVAIYLLVTGSVGSGVVLIAYGVVVIGLADNLLRPILVGRETNLPDWLVLISMLGGIAAFGINGFMIGPVVAGLFITAWEIFSGTATEIELK